jgi:hypothetical protein
MTVRSFPKPERGPLSDPSLFCAEERDRMIIASHGIDMARYNAQLFRRLGTFLFWSWLGYGASGFLSIF